MKKWIIALSAMMACATASAQQIAIVGGTVHTMGPMGSVENGAVLIRDGSIQSVVNADAVPEGYEVIDAAGKVVTPGLFGASTSLGLVEVGMSAGTVDSSVVFGETQTAPVSNVGAALDVQYGINPDSTLIPVSRVEGVTSAATGIGRGEYLFSGQGAVITLSGGADSVLKPKAFMHVDVSNNISERHGGSRAALWVMLNEVLGEAKAAPARLGPTSEWHGITTRADAAALKAVVAGNMPLLVTADRASDIRLVIDLKKRNPQMNVVLVNAVEGWRVANELAAANIPVILDPENNLPGSFDQLGATLANAGRLHKAGVAVSIGMDTHNIRLATQHAGNAVANGLPWEAGLAAVTINPARIYGVADQVGSLESGKRADIVVWSGDPLEVTSHAEHVFINGEHMGTESRQHKLRDRYKNLASDVPMTHVRP
ncbi:amidohydrolase family protein [Aestuariibacter salexigens]|uniref:amidohydrolase family protein n=1 Tax=Aestuariibacter salexigens TaxID=226010 RepID=UPI00040C61CB|nr:amidohydrolase family protein [Aestuariibacter salexigens]